MAQGLESLVARYPEIGAGILQALATYSSLAYAPHMVIPALMGTALKGTRASEVMGTLTHHAKNIGTAAYHAFVSSYAMELLPLTPEVSPYQL